jgi:DMSO reductase family type II enzyme heme b subunit
VQIIQWRADWQKNVDKGETTVRDLYPNAVIDAPVDKVYHYDDIQAFSAGRAIGNIVSQARHFYSVQDLMAEGFGTLTPKPTQNALGKGVWDKGVWKVVIARPMEPVTDPDAALLSSNSTTNVGFAVWNGSAGERGARKGWAGWIPLTIQ